MTDNRTTELREKLTERGIEYETNDSMGAFETRWSGFTVTQISANANLIMAVTPEQAIAAALGSGTLTAEQVREAIERNFGKVAVIDDGGEKVEWREGWVCNVCFNSQAIADELNAELGSQREKELEQLVRDMYDVAARGEFDVGEESRFSERMAKLGVVSEC